MIRFAILGILFLSSVALYAQSDTLLGFDGLVYVEDDKAKGVNIALYDRNENISNYVTNKSGKFVLDLDRGKYYIIEFSKAGYVTKRILIDTRIGNEDLSPKEQFNFDVFLIKMRPNMDYSLLDFPMAIIQFQHDKEKFDFDQKYTRARQSEQKQFIK